MRKLIFLFFIFISLSLFAEKRGKTTNEPDSIFIRLEKVKQLLETGEWQVVDKDKHEQIWEVIHFMERLPIDMVINTLKIDVERGENFLKRETRSISEAEQVEGYINAREINNTLINLEQRVEYQLPLESIIVPEREFVGMYSKLPLIDTEDAAKMLTDSLVTLPDSIAQIVADADSNRNAKNKKVADSLVSAFLDESRKAHNDSLIKSYRDSVAYQYRKNYRNNYVETLKKAYTDSVSRLNYALLKSYNDSATIIVNEAFRNDLNSVLAYVNRMPNDITIYNMRNEPSILSLQNDGLWFKWIYLKNMQNDSIGIRVENLDRNSVRLLVDESVNLSRLTQRTTLDVSRIQSSEAIEFKLRKVDTRKPVLSPWTLGGRAYAGLSQTYINPFWSKGGTSSASVMSTFNYGANYSKGKMKWENGVEAKLGLIQYIDVDDKNPPPRNWHKNSDIFEINSRFGYTAINKWYYSAEANFKTQFFIGYRNNREEKRNSSFFSPAYLTFSGGFDYKPNKDLSAFLSPLSVITTYVIDPEVNVKTYGLDEGTTRKSRIGMTGRFTYAKKVSDNFNVSDTQKQHVFVNFG
jgi:hypothetical protein